MEVSKVIIYRWNEKLNDNDRILESFMSLSKAPKRNRIMRICLKSINFIKSLQESKSHLGKEKIKSLLDDFCKEKNIISISQSTNWPDNKALQFLP